VRRADEILRRECDVTSLAAAPPHPYGTGSVPRNHNFVASAGGAPSHPVWYLNLRSNPAATVQVGGRKLAVTAETVGLEERARLWLRLRQMWPPVR